MKHLGMYNIEVHTYGLWCACIFARAVSFVSAAFLLSAMVGHQLLFLSSPRLRIQTTNVITQGAWVLFVGAFLPPPPIHVEPLFLPPQDQNADHGISRTNVKRGAA